jgi:hypothetical protein
MKSALFASNSQKHTSYIESGRFGNMKKPMLPNTGQMEGIKSKITSSENRIVLRVAVCTQAEIRWTTQPSTRGTDP